jgi:hypothetical protein
MSLEQKIKELCREIIACESDEDAIQQVRELQPLLQRRLSELQSLESAPVRNSLIPSEPKA